MKLGRTRSGDGRVTEVTGAIITCGTPALHGGNWKVDYSIDLYAREEPGEWRAEVLFENRLGLALPALDGIAPDAERNQGPNGSFIYKATGSDTLNDKFASEIAEGLRDLIEQITPIVDDFGNESSEEDVA